MGEVEEVGEVATMAGLPAITWPFVAIALWNFLTAAGGRQPASAATIGFPR